MRNTNQGFQNKGGKMGLHDPYGYIWNDGSAEGGSQYHIAGMKGIGYSVIITQRGGDVSLGTMNWSEWKSEGATSPFCRQKTWTNTSVGNLNQIWSSNDLTGYYFTSNNSSLNDPSGKGYIILHYLQDLSVNTNNGYIEYSTSGSNLY